MVPFTHSLDTSLDEFMLPAPDTHRDSKTKKDPCSCGSSWRPDMT